MKTIYKNRKTYTCLAITLFLFFNILSLSPGIAIHMQGDGATFHLDEEDPLEYGVYHSSPNTVNTFSIDGSNQGVFTIMDWLGDFDLMTDQEIVDYPGEDISAAYPIYFDNYFTSSITNNDYINPWGSVNWLNISAYNAENETLSPYTLNSVFNYYVLIEGGELTAPLNHSIPMQIDIIIEGTGPKVLKADWLTVDPANLFAMYYLVSPSGKMVTIDPQTAKSYAVDPPVEVFDYLTFGAHETGTYRLLVYAWHNLGNPAYLTLEFLKSSISSLPLETLKFVGNAEDILAIEEKEYSTWQSNWFKINGEKGDFFRLELNKDYVTEVMGNPLEPVISLWYPHENGYYFSSLTPNPEGIHDLYFLTSGNAYVSIIDADYGNWYRYSLFAKKYEPIDYNIGDNKTSIRISRDQRKVIKFSVEEDSFVRFNFTSILPGDPYFSGYNFIYEDSKSLTSVNINSYLEDKEVDNEWFYYYYMPAGTYKALIQNSDETKEGVFEISSKFVNWINDTIPINSLTYPDTDPTQFLTLDFEPDEYYNSLKQGIGVGINITEPGQYRLNVTILASDNLAAIPLMADPAAVVVYNYSEDTYHDWTQEALDPAGSFPAIQEDHLDYLYIAYPQKWHDMEFNFSVYSAGATDIDAYLWDGVDFANGIAINDNTNDFRQNGSVIMSLTDPEYSNWIRGANFDLPHLNESRYFWVRITPDTGDFTTIPYIQIIKLSNITLQGDLNFALVRDSGYDYGDFWVPSDQPSDITELKISQELEFTDDSDEIPLIESSEPYFIGIEEGFYKLLIIPERWDYSGPVTIRFAVEDFWSYRTTTTYNISALSPYPNLHKFQINNYTSTAYGNNTEPHYNYELIFEYNDTEAYAGYGDYSYFALECYGKPYQWTQLVAAIENISYYELWIIQDLQWQGNSGPNDEILSISGGTISTNTTFEFGVFEDHFILLFGVMPDIPNEIVRFKISLSQYDTFQFSVSPPIASYKPPLDASLIIILAIVIPAAVGGAIVVIYIVKKKRGGKI
ncbi:MAG: hypothetical protein HWN81_02790 [Candidatus Lokiarchaeota archaeon]|nr:hypothetical protein [Candidatus Lokiarchaeota archaeon]